MKQSWQITVWTRCQVLSVLEKCAPGNAAMKTWLDIVWQHGKWSKFSCFFLSSLGSFSEAGKWVYRTKNTNSECVYSSEGVGADACKSWLAAQRLQWILGLEVLVVSAWYSPLVCRPFMLDIWYYLTGRILPAGLGFDTCIIITHLA